MADNSLKTNVFNKSYLDLTKQLIKIGEFNKSRNGDTVEVLNFKTEIKNPLKRLVGGYGRNINVFFLLQESIWIWLGKKDVEPLVWFNSNMSNFSDDGKVFHAPYGFRLRNYGLPSDKDLFDYQCKVQGKNLVNFPEVGIDQIKECILMLNDNPQDRRVVASIWNPVLDLNFKCKDLPCNDMLMFKIRDNKLHLTIQNRSNDLHWGLPTNVFQFSFILELMATILNVEIGTQTHNSQSLHVYLNNPITLTLLNKGNKEGGILYGDDRNEIAEKIDFFNIRTQDDVLSRLNYVDNTLKMVYDLITYLKSNIDEIDGSGLELLLKELKSRSTVLTGIVKLLFIYLKYKSSKVKNDSVKIQAIKYILRIDELSFKNDFKIMAINFFITRLSKKSGDEYESFKFQLSDKTLTLLDY